MNMQVNINQMNKNTGKPIKVMGKGQEVAQAIKAVTTVTPINQATLNSGKL